MIYKTTELWDLSKTIAAPLLSECVYPWEALPKIEKFIIEIGTKLSKDEYDNPEENVWIAKGVKMASNAVICAPVIIGKDTEIRTGAFIRGKVIIGERCVIGNSCELKNAIVFDNVQIPHFNYIGDSIIGYCSHTGAGVITSNIKSDRTPVCAWDGITRLETNLRKFGAMVGDHVEIGCNSVLNPGTIIGRNSNIYPLSSVRGTVPENSIFKAHDNIVEKIKK